MYLNIILGFLVLYNVIEPGQSGNGTENVESKDKRPLTEAVPNPDYEIIETGSLYSPDYRIYLKKGTNIISPWHDIPLYANDEHTLYNMVVEIPLKSFAKMEINTTESLNPIKQDLNNDGTPRFVPTVHPYTGYIWNYGAFPQTWEDPSHSGDNDPLDVLEIGNKPAKMGQILTVKVLGAIGLIDNGEMDWKILAIDNENPKAHLIDNVNDIEQHFPNLLKSTFDWLKIYKYPSKKIVNSFTSEGEPILKEETVEIIEKTHTYWKNIAETMKKNPESTQFSLLNTTRNDEHTLTQEIVFYVPCLSLFKVFYFTKLRIFFFY